MKLSRYNIISLLLILAIIANSSLITHMWVSGNRGFGFSGAAVLLIILIISVFYHLNRLSRLFLQFTEALKNRDISTGFSRDMDDPFLSRVVSAFTEINRDFGLIRRDKELQHHLFSAAIDHIQFGILVFRNNGEVVLSNRSFQVQMKLKEIKNIDDLDHLDSSLTDSLEKIKKGEEKILEISQEKTWKKYLLFCDEFMIDNEKLRIISIRDITRQIDRSELEAWKKLIRVLRHEILNTLSPVRIHASGLSSIVKKNEFTGEDRENLKIGLDSIYRRAAGLAKFVDSYKSFTELPEPEMKNIELKEFLYGIEFFFRDILQENNIMLNNKVGVGINIRGDEKLLEQVFINIIKNSIEALKGVSSPEINISAEKSHDSLSIRISDNGKGVAMEELENIFIPFYTTRESGSGIGLSISRQIIQMHGGSISAESGIDGGMVFVVRFPVA